MLWLATAIGLLRLAAAGGWRGGKQIEVNARGQMIQVLSEKLPEPGEDIVVTIDLNAGSALHAS